MNAESRARGGVARQRRRRSSGAGTAVGLVGLVCALAAGLRPAAFAQLARSARFVVAAKGTAVTRRASEDASEEAAPARRFMLKPGQLFQELYVTNTTGHKTIMRAVVGAFKADARAVDLVLCDPAGRATIVYAASTLPFEFDAAVQLIPRRGDMRLRARVVKGAATLSQADLQKHKIETFRVSKNTNTTALAYAIRSNLWDKQFKRRARMVKLEFAGRQVAEKAIFALEDVARKTWREVVFSPRFEQVQRTPKKKKKVVKKKEEEPKEDVTAEAEDDEESDSDWDSDSDDEGEEKKDGWDSDSDDEEEEKEEQGEEEDEGDKAEMAESPGTQPSQVNIVLSVIAS